MDRPEGIGIGFRMELAEELLERAPAEVRWLEVHPENYVDRGGYYLRRLERARERWSFATHGLTMCFGNAEPATREYTDGLRTFLRDLGAPWHSDHLCFGGIGGAWAHDLLPIPFTEESVANAVTRVKEAQDALGGVPVAVENVSYYAAQSADPLDEASFVAEVLARTDARLMLDVNNVYVNSKNFGFDPKAWMDRVPLERVVQMHVAGHKVRNDGLRIDTHAEDVCDEVYDLLEHVLERTGPTAVLLERDAKIPPLDEVLVEVRRLTEVYDRAMETHARNLRAKPAGEAS